MGADGQATAPYESEARHGHRKPNVENPGEHQLHGYALFDVSDSEHVWVSLEHLTHMDWSAFRRWNANIAKLKDGRISKPLYTPFARLVVIAARCEPDEDVMEQHRLMQLKFSVDWIHCCPLEEDNRSVRVAHKLHHNQRELRQALQQLERHNQGGGAGEDDVKNRLERVAELQESTWATLWLHTPSTCATAPSV